MAVLPQANNVSLVTADALADLVDLQAMVQVQVCSLTQFVSYHKFHSNVSISLDATNSRQHQIEIEWVYLLSSTFLSVAVRSFCLAVSQNLTLSHSDLKAKNLMAFSRAVFRLEARRDIV